MTEDRTVSLNAVENIVNKYIDGSFEWGAMLVQIKQLPSIDRTVQEFADRCRECGKQRTGHWIGTSSTARTDNGIELYGYACSNCKKITYSSALTPRCCPWCGNNKVEGR